MDALKAARATIARRAKDPRAIAFGFSDDLKAIGCALDELEGRTDALAAQLLRIRAGFDPHRAQLDELGTMGPASAVVLRTMRHGANCCCGECM